MNRLLVTTAAALALACLVPGCADRVPQQPPPRRSLRMVLASIDSPAVAQGLGAALTGYLEANLGMTVRVTLTPDYRAMSRLLAQGWLDLAWVSPVVWARGRGTIPYEPLCRVSRHGRTTQGGVITVRASSPYRTVDDLRGTVFTYVDRLSATGFICPNRLFERRGIDPLRFFKEVGFARNHEAALDDLLSGACDAAAVHDAARPSGGPAALGRLRVLERTGEVGSDVLIVRGSLEPARKALLSRLFLEMETRPQGGRALAAIRAANGVDRFVPAADRDDGLDGR